MSQYLTVVIRMPVDARDRAVVNKALEAIRPHVSGMSQEDEMTVLECIEQHDEFDDWIAEAAREQTAQLHARAEASDKPNALNVGDKNARAD